MNKRLPLLSLFAAAALGQAVAGINSPTSEGYLARGVEMMADRNFTGCLDQLSHIDRSSLSAEQVEQAEWLIAEATFALYGADARQLFVDFIGRYPYSLRRNQAAMRLGDCYFESDYARALAEYDDVARGALTASEATDLDYRRAYCMLKLEDYDRADTLFGHLTADKTYGNAARFYQAYIAYAGGEMARAEQLFKKVDTSVSPGNMADYYLAQIYYLDGDYRRTLSSAKALLRRSDVPAQFTAEINRLAGESEFQLGNLSSAIPYLKKYVASTDAPALSTLYILGLSQYRQGEYSDAVKSLEPVTASDDAMGQSASLIAGQAMLKLGEKDAALLAFDNALRLDYDKAVQEAAYYNYAVAKFSGASIPFGSTVSTFETFLSRFPDSKYAPEVQEYIVDGYLTDHNYEQALESINRMKRPSAAVLAAKQKVLYNLGASALAAGNPAKALVYLEEADNYSKFDSGIAAEVKLLTGEATYRTGDYAKSRMALKEFLAKTAKNNVNRPLAYYDLGYTEFAAKKYKDAAAAFRNFVDAPGDLQPKVVADAYNRLADISYYASDFAKAQTLYDKAYSTNPSSGDYALFQTAIMKGYNRDHKGKIEALRRLPEEFPSSTLRADALLEMTASYIQLDDNDSAIETYRRLVAEYPNTAQGRQGYLQLAITLLNADRRPEAIESYRDIIRLYPTSDEAREANEQLKRIAADDGTLDQYAEFIKSVPDAPTIDVAEVERLSFDAAEKQYLKSEATDKLRAYVDQYPSGAYRARALGLLLEHAREHSDEQAAVTYAGMLVEDYPDNSLTEPAFAIKANDLYNKGDAESALKVWQALENRASSSKNLNAARAGIMRAAHDLGDYNTVAAAADALLASSTLGSEDKNEAIFEKALALSQTDRTAEARELWQTIAPMTDDLYGAKSAYYLAQNYFDEGLMDKARTNVEALNASGTPHSYWLARGFILLSDIYAAEGKTFEAREYLKALKENYPGSESDIFILIDTRLSSLDN